MLMSKLSKVLMLINRNCDHRSQLASEMGKKAALQNGIFNKHLGLRRGTRIMFAPDCQPSRLQSKHAFQETESLNPCAQQATNTLMSRPYTLAESSASYFFRINISANYQTCIQQTSCILYRRTTKAQALRLMRGSSATDRTYATSVLAFDGTLLV